VAIAENSVVGGTCVIRGCVPKLTLTGDDTEPLIVDALLCATGRTTQSNIFAVGDCTDR
uniref:Glutathione reductase (Fragments) n=1 Tax=Spirulina sp. TaxID=1157 RepID=GSHR_SPISP|nr:RecName: Full=Glutathione reductase; Short=GR; Short=GRase [Spirulina sp.]